VSAFALLSFWACAPHSPAGFVWPKILVLALGALACALRSRPAWLLALAVAAAAAWWGDNPALSVVGFPGEWTGGLLALSFYALLTLLPTRFPWLKWAGICLATHAIAQYAGLDPLIKLGGLDERHAVTWVGSHVDTGALLAMAAPVVGWGWIPWIALGLLACKARGAMLGAAFALTPGRWRWAYAPLVLVPLFFNVLHAPKDVARGELSRIAVRGWLERPFLGHGPETYRLTLDRLKTPALVAAVGPAYEQSHAHNDLLEALHGAGILGLLAYLLLVWPLLADPSLLALFVDLKFNPVSFEVLSAAALVAANVYRDRKGGA
jgi:hypothetical protein